MNIFCKAAGVSENSAPMPKTIGGCMTDGEFAFCRRYLRQRGFKTNSDFVRECIRFYMESHRGDPDEEAES